MMNVTNRRQKRFIKKEEETKYKRYDNLRKANDAKEMIELAKPEFSGYKRYFIMTDRANGSKYAADYINLLQENNGIRAC